MGEMLVNKEFKQKVKDEELEDYLKKQYEKICSLHANLGFLLTYCRAYLSADGVFEFIPFLQHLKELTEEIAIEMQRLTDSPLSVKERNCFIDEFYLANNCTLKDKNR